MLYCFDCFYIDFTFLQYATSINKTQETIINEKRYEIPNESDESDTNRCYNDNDDLSHHGYHLATSKSQK